MAAFASFTISYLNIIAPVGHLLSYGSKYIYVQLKGVPVI